VGYVAVTRALGGRMAIHGLRCRQVVGYTASELDASRATLVLD
jgi:hypothetical protein